MARLCLMCVQAMVPWWRWYYYVNPISWTLYAIIVTQLGDDSHVVCLRPPPTSTLCTLSLQRMAVEVKAAALTRTALRKALHHH